MDKFQDFINALDITAAVSDEEIERTKIMLQLYSPTLRHSANSLSEMEDECFETRRQAITDFVNLAIDYDHDKDRKRIAERLSDIVHSMQLLSIMEEALIRLKDEGAGNGMYYDLIRTRYFDSYCNSNEDAYRRHPRQRQGLRAPLQERGGCSWALRRTPRASRSSSTSMR